MITSFARGLLGLVSLAAAEAAADPPGAMLAREVRMEEVLALALTRNPDLAEEEDRVAVAQARRQRAARLPDLRLKSELWGVPLERPLALGQADTVMVGLSQALPAWGTRAADERAAEADVKGAAATQELRRRELRGQVRRAFADYYRADRQLGLHREHVELTGRLVELSRASYRAGHRGQADVLRLGLELSRLHSDVAHIEQERRSAAALLNALMARALDAPLGPPAELRPRTAPVTAEAELLRDAEERRPELAAAQATVARSEAALAGAAQAARWPSLMVGADYWYMPREPHVHGYGAMVSMSLPWLNPAHDDEVRTAARTLSAERHALGSVRATLRYQARDAVAKFEAARSTFAIVDTDLLPQAQRNFEAAQSAYAAGQGDALGLIDALRSLLDVRLDRVRALVHLETAAADLERILGGKESSP